jgi:hypothetical protein
MKKIEILAIDDRQEALDDWERIVLGTGKCNFTGVCGPTANDLRDKLGPILEDGSFDGTILDIGFQGAEERFGGIDLWNQLRGMGLTNNAGQLMVGTNFTEPPIVDFINANATTSTSSLFAPEIKAAKFAEFLEHIRDRVNNSARRLPTAKRRRPL